MAPQTFNQSGSLTMSKSWFCGCVFAATLVWAGQGLAAEPDVVIADFEGPTYGDWQISGRAFGPGPAQGTLPGQMPVEGFNGKGLVNSYYGGDGSTGTLTSPAFRIQRHYIGFLIGGGKDAAKTCMNLLIEGKVVRNATGPNDRPGGSEALEPGFWDVSEFAGKTAIIQIVDQATGGWGHINVDDIIQTDRRPPRVLTPATRQLTLEKRYLNLPVKTGGPKRQVRLEVPGEPAYAFEIELADGAPDWWAFIDVSAWKGKSATLQVDRLAETSKGLAEVYQSEAIADAATLYREPLRAQFHFSSRRGWNNDPNGLVFYKGEYHLFYQHNPFGWNSANMHWGHAVSPDLVHWRELADALAPDALGAMWSGSAVVDWQNTSGLGGAGQAPMVLFYTAAGASFGQCLASSLDGRHFSKFSGNPVVRQITHGNRDPKVFWHEPSHQWVMCLYVELNGVHTIHFLGSPNLKDWKVMSHTDGFFECPDFFELPVGNGPERKWVLTAASSEYKVGTFDGHTFTPETPKLPGHRGRGFYAAQTFSDLPQSDGRRIQIGWLQTETPGMSFNQALSLPLELKLVPTPAGPRLTWSPVRELTSLRGEAHHCAPLTLQPERANPLAEVKAELVELRAAFVPGKATTVFNVRGATISYDAAQQELIVNGHHAPAPLQEGKQHVTIYCDRTALEIFASNGLTYVPMPFIPKADDRSLSVRAEGGAVAFEQLDAYELKSAWR